MARSVRGYTTAAIAKDRQARLPVLITDAHVISFEKPKQLQVCVEDRIRVAVNTPVNAANSANAAQPDTIGHNPVNSVAPTRNSATKTSMATTAAKSLERNVSFVTDCLNSEYLRILRTAAKSKMTEIMILTIAMSERIMRKSGR
jgi:hypothetical protein